MTREKDASAIRWSELALVVPPVLLLILADALLIAFQWPALQPVLLDAPSPWLDAVGRVYILAAALGGATLTLLALLHFVSDIRREFDAAMQIKLFATFFTGLGIGSIWLIFLKCSGELPAAGELAGLMSSALEKFEPGTDRLYRFFETLAGTTRALLMIGAATVVVGSVSCLATPQALPRAEADQRSFVLRQQRRLRTYVDMSAALMVMSVLFAIAWMRWPQHLLAKEAAASFAALTNALSFYTGATSSLAILVFALPVAKLLQGRMPPGELPSGAATDAGVFSEGLTGNLAKALVVLTPTFAGALPSLIQLLHG